jgi:4-amino-4-deoxy-L-arabinose transferase-like glycosyltransferase
MQVQRLIGKLKSQNFYKFSTKIIFSGDYGYLLILIFVSALRFLNLGNFDLQSWDEALYAVRAKSILYFGCFWDQSTYAVNGLYSASHPPLYIWLTTLSFSLFGINEFAARFFSSLFGVGCIILTYYFGKKLFSPKVGFFSAIFLSINPFFTFWSMQAQFDVALTFFFSISIYFYYKSIESNSTRDTILTGIFAGLALMTKLFVGGIALIIIFLYEIFNKKEFEIKKILIIFFMTLVIALPWHIYMIFLHSNYDLFFFFKQAQLFDRTFSGIENNSKELGIFFFINQLIVYTPLLLIPFLVYLLKNRKIIIKDILFIWFILYFLIISAISTKLPVYLIPSLIPFMILSVKGFFILTEIKSGTQSKMLLLTGINILFIWSLDHNFRVMIKDLIKGSQYTNINILLQNFSWLIALFACLELASLFFIDKLPLKQLANTFLVLFCAGYFVIYAFNLSENNLDIYNSGLKEVMSKLNQNKLKNLFAIGHGINPQLSYYSNGLDLNWNQNIKFQRFDPKNNIGEIYKYLFLNNQENTYIIYEKSDYYLYHVLPRSVVPEKYKSLVETKEYILYSSEFTE